MTRRTRKIIHIDMDCFYAAVEMRDDPGLRDIPLAVGGSAERRGVISTCNYLAREFGIHSSMATAHGMRLCPALTVLPVRMAHYQAVSQQLRAIFRDYTPLVEPLSLDEAFLDVSDSRLHQGSATLIARDIRARIRQELNLTASAGVAPNKFLAKICSDENKPDGQFVVTPAQVDEFCNRLPLGKIPGVGKVTVGKLAKLGLHHCADVRALGEPALVQQFGSLGVLLHQRAHGIDDRQLQTEWVRKSVSVERTFPEDIPKDGLLPMDELFAELKQRLERHSQRQLRKQQLKLKFSDFTVTTMERQSSVLNKKLFLELLPLAWDRGGSKAIRLLGLGVAFKDEPEAEPQLTLFE